MAQVSAGTILERVPPHGPTTGLLVVGPAGTGKTRLLDDCTAEYRASGAAVVELAGRRADTTGLEAVSVAAGRAISSADEARSAILDVLDLDAGGVVVVDDAHLLDAGTTIVLAKLMERPPASGIRMLVARRPVTAEGPAAFLDAALIRLQPLLELAFREPEDARRLVAAEWSLASGAAREVAVALAWGVPPEELNSLDSAHDPIEELASAGLLDEAGQMPPSVREAVLHQAGPTLLAALERRHPVAAGRARLRAGQLADALRCAEAVGDEHGLRLAAAAHAAAGRWASAAAALRSAASDANLAASELARVVVAVPAATEDRNPPPEETPGAEARCLRLMASGLGRGSIPELREASGLAADLPSALLPDDPAAVLILTAAEACEFGLLPRSSDESPAEGRVRTATAWATMVSGDYHRTTRLTTNGTDARTQRETLVGAAVHLGLALRSGDVDALQSAWPLALSATGSVSVDLLLVPMLGEIRVAAARLSRGDELGGVIDEIESLLVALDHPRPWSAGWAWRAVRAAVAGDDVAALEMACEHLTALRAPLVSEYRLAADAWLRTCKGSPDLDATLEGADALDGLGLRWEATRLLGATAVRQADGDSAKRLLQRAREWREALPPIEIGSAERRSGPLTEREWEVAERVVAGLTHKEAGAQLYMSPKTVEHHVARIRKKLGVSTRAQMIATLRELLEP